MTASEIHTFDILHNLAVTLVRADIQLDYNILVNFRKATYSPFILDKKEFEAGKVFYISKNFMHGKVEAKDLTF